MQRWLDLGTTGEEAYEAALSHMSLWNGKAFVGLLKSPYAEALAEVRRRFKTEGYPIYEGIHEDRSPLSYAEDLGDEVRRAKGEKPAIIWMEARPYCARTMRQWMGNFGVQREPIFRSHQCVWIFAGPPDIDKPLVDSGQHFNTLLTVRGEFNELPKKLDVDPPREPGIIRWLHLSDFHFRAGHSWERVRTLKALLKKVGELREVGLQPDLLFVTGDIAFSGKEAEYRNAEQFYHQLRGQLGWDEQSFRERAFFVPGNHDVDREKITEAAEAAIGQLWSREAAQRAWTKDPEEFAFLHGRKLKSYYDFVQRMRGDDFPVSASVPYRLDRMRFWGVDLAIAQWNSAWACLQGRDYGELLLGEEQVEAVLKEPSLAEVRIGLVHHPLSYLREFDRDLVGGILRRDNEVHFLLRGHLHKSEASLRLDPDGGYFELAAGATYDESDYPRRFLIGELDYRRRRLRVRFYSYSSESGGFWTVDNTAYKSLKDGVYEGPCEQVFGPEPGPALSKPFALSENNPPEIHGSFLPTPALSTVPLTITPGGDSAELAFRYRAAFGKQYGKEALLAAAGSRRESRASAVVSPHRQSIEDWYISPALKEVQGERSRQLSLSEFWDELTTEAKFRRAVILAPVGTGKSSLLARLGVAAASPSGAESELSPVEGLWPLLLRVRGYAEKMGTAADTSILESVSALINSELQLKIPVELLQEKMREGRALLLVDGLDEAGSEKRQREVCDRIGVLLDALQTTSAATQEISGPLVLVTARPSADPSRFFGRDSSFRRFELLPFDDGQQEQYFEKALKGTEEPSEANEDWTSFRNRLRGESALRELAENPLIARIVASLVAAGKTLGATRGSLLSACLDHLLERAAERLVRPVVDVGAQRRILRDAAQMLQRLQEEGEAIAARLIGDWERYFAMSCERTLGLRAEAAKGLVDHLLEAGILAESAPHALSFAHQAFFEQLAAEAALEQAQTAKALADAVIEEVRNQRSMEWAQLVVDAALRDKEGRCQSTQGFATELFRAAQEAGTWEFLLERMAERLDFGEALTREILEAVSWRIPHRHQTKISEIMRRVIWSLPKSIAASHRQECFQSGDARQALGYALCESRPEDLPTDLVKRAESEEDAPVFFSAASAPFGYTATRKREQGIRILGERARKALNLGGGIRWAQSLAPAPVVTSRLVRSVQQGPAERQEAYVAALLGRIVWALRWWRVARVNGIPATPWPLAPLDLIENAGVWESKIAELCAAHEGLQIEFWRTEWLVMPTPRRREVSEEAWEAQSLVVPGRFASFLDAAFSSEVTRVCESLRLRNAASEDPAAEAPVEEKDLRIEAALSPLRLLPVGTVPYYPGIPPKLITPFKKRLKEVFGWIDAAKEKGLAEGRFEQLHSIFDHALWTEPLDRISGMKSLRNAFAAVQAGIDARELRAEKGRSDGTQAASPSPSREGADRVAEALARSEYEGTQARHPNSSPLPKRLREGLADWRVDDQKLLRALAVALPAEDWLGEAALLCLSWTQALTTRDWPGGPAVESLLNTRPEHWLPRSQWALVQWLANPDQQEPKAVYAEAIAEGHKDNHWSAFATALDRALKLEDAPDLLP